MKIGLEQRKVPMHFLQETFHPEGYKPAIQGTRRFVFSESDSIRNSDFKFNIAQTRLQFPMVAGKGLGYEFTMAGVLKGLVYPHRGWRHDGQAIAFAYEKDGFADFRGIALPTQDHVLIMRFFATRQRQVAKLHNDLSITVTALERP